MKPLAQIAFLALLAGCQDSSSPVPGSSSAVCTSQQWVNAWQAPPSDATMPADRFITPTLPGPLQTYRAVFSPLGSGEVIRLQLSNRFGLTQITFNSVWIAKRTSDASVDPETMVQLSFNGSPAVTIPAGQDVTTDSAVFPFNGLDDVAVSIYATNPGVIPTHHYQARQWSYITLPLAGDHTRDAEGGAFTTKVSLRPFVIAMDTLSPGSTSTLVAFGDSLTDGDRVPPSFPVGLEDRQDIDHNARYPDFLYRRLAASGRRVFVSNAGIGANRVLADANPVLAFGGPSALKRMDQDVLGMVGVTDVLVWEGINDIANGASAADLIEGYKTIIGKLQARGINVIQGTVTPAGGAPLPVYDSADAQAQRQAVNEWIRTRSPANSVVDFDAAVRDGSNPNVLDARYDGGDHLHFNAAGYERLAAAVDLDSIRGARCER